jgi:hypothetical protein
MTEVKNKELLEAELEHYALLKKNREGKLEKIRLDFPDVPVEKILEKYRYGNQGSSVPRNTGSAKSSKTGSII